MFQNFNTKKLPNTAGGCQNFSARLLARSHFPDQNSETGPEMLFYKIITTQQKKVNDINFKHLKMEVSTNFVKLRRF